MNSPLRKAVLEALPNTRGAVIKAVTRRGGYTRVEVNQDLDSLLWSGQIVSRQGTLMKKG